MSTVLSLSNLPRGHVSRVGGKAASLANLIRWKLPVPGGFVIPADSFTNGVLSPATWAEVQEHAQRLGGPFAVRSSAAAEDGDASSFAGEFESLLDVPSGAPLRAAIDRVYASRAHERARAYEDASDLEREQPMAVIVQKMVRADFAGVLFTADPVTGSHHVMVGNYVRGLGEKLVSGEADAIEFRLAKPKGGYTGPAEFAKYAKQLHAMASTVERHAKKPQDLEFAVAGDRVFLVQSRPISTMSGYDPRTGTWNDSHRGDFLWTSTNTSEAIPVVMTPSTWSVVSECSEQLIPIALPCDAPIVGNIGGRMYLSVTYRWGLDRLFGISEAESRAQMVDVYGQVPDTEIPAFPLGPADLLRDVIPSLLRVIPVMMKDARERPALTKESKAFQQRQREQFRSTTDPVALEAQWRETIIPENIRLNRTIGVMTTNLMKDISKLRRSLEKIVGSDDALTLTSTFSTIGGPLESLGPTLGLQAVLRGEMSREEYQDRYGHRGPYEGEFSCPRPYEDSSWLDTLLAEAAKSGFDGEAVLAKQRASYEATLGRLREKAPIRSRYYERRLHTFAGLAHERELLRTEATRYMSLFRDFYRRAGELTGLGDDIFFLTSSEMLRALHGNLPRASIVQKRREAHARFSALPTYPQFIRGRFDPVVWAESADRRADFVDQLGRAERTFTPTDGIRGIGASVGIVEGRARVLSRIEELESLERGDILVTHSTNIGWTPAFSKIAGIVTDIGAPLSHAAIVAREFGIPAVVGAGTASRKIETGMRIRVDGGSGAVEILSA